MAQRKLQQEVDRCFKRVAEGIQAFEGIFDKILQTTNASQKEKLEDALKREIKKLQRQRDQIKTWAASNEIKDKKPLLEHRKLIETQMEKFKAVEKEMKTKAYSKEGLSGAAKLDPKEKEKLEACQFLSSMVEALERQIETVEAEAESLQVNMKKSKRDTSKAERIAEIERLTERHKWHQGKLELILRLLENGSLETDQVTDLQESIKYYVESNQDVDFMEDDAIYDELNLDEDDDAFGAGNDNDRLSSQDAQSVQDDTPETESRGASIGGGKPKSSSVSEAQAPQARRHSTQMKSPLPALATLHNPLSSNTSGIGTSNSMKPAPLPTRPPGETLKYASAAAAATAGDKNNVGIAPLPPPPGAVPSSSAATTGITTSGAAKSSATSSPSVVTSQPVSTGPTPAQKPAIPSSGNVGDGGFNTQPHFKSPALSHSSVGVAESSAKSAPDSPNQEKSESVTSHDFNQTTVRPSESEGKRRLLPRDDLVQDRTDSRGGVKWQPSDEVPVNGDSHDLARADTEKNESVYHLPPGLQDLIQSFETTKSRLSLTPTPSSQRLLAASHATCPISTDADRPRHNKSQTRWNTPSYYPQEPLAIFDDQRLYSRIDTDTLFYVFYYRQGSYQQYLAAKALKNQSWRFHKQYQTWFQRHEEPKTITEEFEQGTYRFFDYESTWMNRRKADFKFAYKFLEDDL
ncbi:MAG: general negative regulator of transcription subunit 5 [Sclerophora amabilis]|nr:MAG: general negative regulator of transcription subunit 5 [Sclerophora amabilis]